HGATSCVRYAPLCNTLSSAPRGNGEVMECGSDQPGGGASLTHLLQVGRIAYPAGANDGALAGTPAHSRKGFQVGAGVGADAIKGHHDHAVGPAIGTLPASGRVHGSTALLVERQQQVGATL